MALLDTREYRKYKAPFHGATLPLWNSFPHPAFLEPFPHGTLVNPSILGQASRSPDAARPAREEP